jgi:broad specificity phosphatase PhoE
MRAFSSVALMLSRGPDPLLTDRGEAQARNTSAAWKAQAAAGAPLPVSFYSSPLTRSSDTLALTWAPVVGVNEDGGPSPVIIEVAPSASYGTLLANS